MLTTTLRLLPLAIGLAFPAKAQPVIPGPSAEACRAIDCSGRQISCGDGIPTAPQPTGSIDLPIRGRMSLWWAAS
jgi:hypothetical protein